jgi:5-methylcytosine-specific restriction endonuclease McrA
MPKDEVPKSSENKAKRRRYITWRRFFIKLLGSKCKKCGTDKSLEIDHINPADHNKNSGIGRDNRLRDWKEEYFKGNLQLLCRSCNQGKRRFHA